MDDFASAAMMRVVREGLRRQGIAPPPAPAQRGGQVALPDKRARLEALWAAHGPQVIARLGEAVHGMGEDPLLTAFAPARDPLDLIERWQRLERFVHSRHRVEVVDRGEHHLRWRHVSLRPGEPPTAAEDLLVAGVLVALVHRSGWRGLDARVAGDRVWRCRDGQWQRDRWPDELHTWEWRWRGLPLQPAVQATGDGLALLSADPGCAWSLRRLAESLGTSPRTLQRRLGEQGRTFRECLTLARLNHAARRLTEGQAGLAEIGYLSGFADQPHFTRQFRAHTGLTPAQYREQFGPLLSRSATGR
ncbi:helix-turn-helix transcriptional regulator [Hydrogenophaga sp. XSHU_21]